MTILKEFKKASIFLLVFSLLTGVFYPLIVTSIAQIFFPTLANGSLIIQNDKKIGSQFIGQLFQDKKYFWGRPSATPYISYNSLFSKGSNLSPFNPQLTNDIKERIAKFSFKNESVSGLIPSDLITASASGLDPDISPLAAMYQVSRISVARHIPQKKLFELVQQYTQRRSFCFLGEPRVNVLLLNLALDNITKQRIVHE